MRIRYLLAGAGTCLLGFGFIRLGRGLPETALGRWIDSWYSIPVEVRRSRSVFSGYHTRLLGNEISLWLAIAAVVLAIGAIYWALQIWDGADPDPDL